MKPPTTRSVDNANNSWYGTSNRGRYAYLEDGAMFWPNIALAIAAALVAALAYLL